MKKWFIHPNLEGAELSFEAIRNRKTYKLKIRYLFILYLTEGLFWFRIFGKYGLHGMNIKKHIVLFSDRYRPRLKIGNWIFKCLK